METLSKPFTECYVFDDPSRVYDLTGWNREEKLYRLETDCGKKRFLRYFEFCPISQAHDELIEAGDDGKLYTAQQLVDSNGHLAWKRPAWAENEYIEGVALNPWSKAKAHEGPPEARPCTPGTARPEVAAGVPKAKGSQAKATRDATADSGLAVEAKAAVRTLLEPCKSREEIAAVGYIYLGEDAGALLSKYMHLDNGRFRMTIGNRMVGLYKKQGGFK